MVSKLNDSINALKRKTWILFTNVIDSINVIDFKVGCLKCVWMCRKDA